MTGHIAQNNKVENAVIAFLSLLFIKFEIIIGKVNSDWTSTDKIMVNNITFHPNQAPKTIAIIVSPSPKALCFIQIFETKEIISKNKNAMTMPIIPSVKV